MFTKKYCMRFLPVLLLLFCSTTQVLAQLDGKKNTIKVNITNPMIFGGKSIMFGYERVVSKHQSFTAQVGQMYLPKFGHRFVSDSVSLRNNSNEKGFHISGNYRFYLSKENKFEAPRGVYIGPYYSFNYFSRDNEWDMLAVSYNGGVNTNTEINIHTAGVELGYQFVFWKKLVIDLELAGPGIGFYDIKSRIYTSLPPQAEEIFFQRLNEYLQEKIPGYSHVIDEDEFKARGSAKTTALGYRYIISIGYRF